MKVIISFCGLQKRQDALQSKRPFALQPLASSTILGHIFERLKDRGIESWTILVNEDSEAIQQWIISEFPDHNVQVRSGGGKTPLDGLTQHQLDGETGSVLFVSGEFVTEADYDHLEGQNADVVCLVQQGLEIIAAESLPVDQQGVFTGEWGSNEVMWAGCIWFRRTADLMSITADSNFRANPYLNTLLGTVKEQGLVTSARTVQSCFGTGTPERLLHANARLMQLGYSSDDAIERSYSEEFTVLPPVYLHETAIIENSVVGPFVNVGAGAILRSSIVRNSFIAEGAVVEDAVLEGSFIGLNSHLTGKMQTLILGDEALSGSD